ncbi:MAG: MBL fold metallo-hydrolase [Clostridia bacterium]|nr:MBL fold metallo-hydrolase [Clostridia bacterium]
MKHTEQKSIRFGKWLRLVLPVLLLAAALSCFFPAGHSFWEGLLAKAGFSHFAAGLSENELHIHVIDVGKADAILIESPDAALLVDTGTKASAETVLAYLAERGVESLDAVWISHSDSDHSGGLEAITARVEAKEIVHSAYAVMPETGIQDKIVQPGETHQYGKLVLEVLAPGRAFDEENDNSLVFRLRYGDFTMLFCGDIEAEAEAALLETAEDLHADVLKAAHHGSDTSTSAEFLAAVSPEYAVISVGEDRNDLPRNAVLKRLRDAGVMYYRTDTDGTVVVSTDGARIDILTENTGAAAGD